jgi:RNA polymerase sigma factor (sigma-70 family)
MLGLIGDFSNTIHPSANLLVETRESTGDCMEDIVPKIKAQVLIKLTTQQPPVAEPALVARAVIEPSAFAELYDHYFPLVHKYVLYRVRDAQMADDLTSQIFERLLNDLSRYRAERAPFGAWLFGIARHVIGDHFRVQKRRRWLSLDGLHQLFSPEPPPEAATLQGELRDSLLAAVGRLSDRERDLIGLKFAAGLNNRQIATLTGLKESHVGVIFYRAMQHLRTELSDKEPSDD